MTKRYRKDNDILTLHRKLKMEQHESR